jgi:hypothetical protein
VKGRGLKCSRKSIFVGGTSNPQRREGGSFYTILQKLAVETSQWKSEHSVFEI